jgi:hypothetical protein
LSRYPKIARVINLGTSTGIYFSCCPSLNNLNPTRGNQRRYKGPAINISTLPRVGRKKARIMCKRSNPCVAIPVIAVNLLKIVDLSIDIEIRRAPV